MPAGNTPSEDFVAKFAAVKYVADPGNTQWRAYLLTDDGIEVFPGIFGFPVVNPLTLGALRPLPVGPTSSRRIGAPAPTTSQGARKLRVRLRPLAISRDGR